MTLTVGSLFSGIGGLDLGLERAGIEVRWQSEIDPYASRVLAKHWPTVPNLGDITTIDWSTVEHVDLICGGYPCQPFSLAGVRRGEGDPRHLWPHFADALRHLRPRWALLENVPGHLSLGFGRVLGDLAELGFDAEWDCIPAAAVGAPHLRYRIFVVASHPDPDRGRLEVGSQLDGEPDSHPSDGGPRRRHPDGLRHALPDADRHPVRDQPVSIFGGGGAAFAEHDGGDRDVADADGTPRSATRGAGEAVPRPGAVERPRRRGSSIGGAWAAEPGVGRVAHGVPARVDRLRTLGNAVVPQVAEWVGRRILEAAA